MNKSIYLFKKGKNYRLDDTIEATLEFGKCFKNIDVNKGIDDDLSEDVKCMKTVKITIEVYEKLK